MAALVTGRNKLVAILNTPGTKNKLIRLRTPDGKYIRKTSGTPDVDYQAIFMGVNEGAAVTVTTAVPTNVFQAATDEIRPPTRVQKTHPGDAGPAIAATFVMDISNDGITAVTVNLWIMAAAAPGGS